MHDDDDGVGATRVIVLPLLPVGVKFTITSTMLQMLTLKGFFNEVASEDANQHIMNFVATCQLSEILGVNQ